MSSAVRAVSATASRKQADRELWALRDNVLRLEEELAFSNARLEKITEQFSCLIELLHKYDFFSFAMSLYMSAYVSVDFA